MFTMSQTKITLSVYLILSAVFLHGSSVEALQCYVCRGCTEVTDSDLVTCALPETTTTESSASSTTLTTITSETDTDAPSTNNESPTTVSNPTNSDPTSTEQTRSPTIEVTTSSTTEQTTSLATEQSTVSSEEPVSRRSYKPSPRVLLMRTLKQFRSDNEMEARCIATYYRDPETEETNVVRACAFVNGDEEFDTEQKCRNVIGENFVGDLETCRVCNEDGCNSAGKAASAIIVFLISLACTRLI